MDARALLRLLGLLLFAGASAAASSPVGTWAIDGPAMQAQADRIAEAMLARLRPSLPEIRARAARMEQQLARLRAEATKDPRKAAMLPRLEAGLGPMRAMAADPEGFVRAQARAVAGSEGTVELLADGRAVTALAGGPEAQRRAEGRWTLAGDRLRLSLPGPGEATGGPRELRLEGPLADDRITLRWLDPPQGGDPQTDALWRDYRVHLVRR